jgi:hypothetical protein
MAMKMRSHFRGDIWRPSPSYNREFCAENLGVVIRRRLDPDCSATDGSPVALPTASWHPLRGGGRRCGPVDYSGARAASPLPATIEGAVTSGRLAALVNAAREFSPYGSINQSLIRFIEEA